jgi:hypothetical protein
VFAEVRDDIVDWAVESWEWRVLSSAWRDAAAIHFSSLYQSLNHGVGGRRIGGTYHLIAR